MSAQTFSDAERRIALDGCRNFRDLGGYVTADGQVVRWRRLFRADRLHALTTADERCLREEYGLRTVIDLRSPRELETTGRGALEPKRFHHLPLVDDVGGPGTPFPGMVDLYMTILRTAGPRLTGVLHVLADDRAYPAVVHCTAGKDRTGLVSALVLSILGVPDADVARDYALTETLDADRVTAFAGEDGRPPAEILEAREETMVAVQSAVRAEWGSFAGYARTYGFDERSERGLRTALLNRRSD